MIYNPQIFIHRIPSESLLVIIFFAKYFTELKSVDYNIALFSPAVFGTYVMIIPP